MKQAKKENQGLVAWIILLFIVLTVGGIVTSNENDSDHGNKGRFSNVRSYKNVVHKALAQYDLQNYTVVLLALMQQESRGKGGDPMQSSESAGLAPGAIENPKKSIRQGVEHFQHVLKYGRRKGVDFLTIIQSYNMGIGYIHYVAKHGGKHSKALAKKFSLMQVHENPELYDCGGDKDNFRYPYCYGDFTYTAKVLDYIDALKATARVSND